MTSPAARRVYTREALLGIGDNITARPARYVRRLAWYLGFSRSADSAIFSPELFAADMYSKRKCDGHSQNARPDQGSAGANPGPRASTTPKPRTTTARTSPSEINIASLNVRTLKADWRLTEAIALMIAQNIDVFCVIETRRRVLTDTTCDGYILKSFPANEAGIGGIGFIFSPKVWPFVLDLTLDSRISTAAMSLRDRKLVIACVYSPTSPRTEVNPSETDAFYASLTSMCNNTPKRDFLFIAGDLNAPLKCDGCLVTAPAPGQENANSDKLRAFALGNDIFLANGKLRQKPSRAATFHGPNNRKTRLDWIMTRLHHRQAVKRIRSIRLTTLRSDHTLLLASLSLKWPHRRKAPSRPDWSALKNSNLATKFQEEVSRHFINSAQDLESAIKETSHILPPAKPNKSSTSILDNSTLQQLRSSLQSACNKYGHSSEVAAKAESRLAEAHKLATEQQLKELSSRLDQAHAAGNSKEAWSIINSATGRKDRPQSILAASSIEDRLDKAANYFHSLLNRSPANALELKPQYPYPPSELYADLLTHITLSEVRHALSSTRLDNAAGPDEIPARALQVTVQHVTRVINNHSAINGGRAPEKWKQSIIVSIPKKGSAKSLENQRGISLMCTAAKLNNRIILNRLRPVIIDRLSPFQAGFLPSRSTTQQLAALRILIDDCRKFQRSVSIAFVDFQKAFDSISRSAIPQCLRYHAVPDVLIEAVMDMYTNTSARIKIGKDLSESFTTTSGVLQGDTLAPFLFIIVLDAVLRDAQLSGYTLRRRQSTRSPEVRLPFLAFADDIALLSDNSADLQSAMDRLYHSARKVGLTINAIKTQALHIGARNPSPLTLPSGERIKEVTNFAYLGGKVANPDSALSACKVSAWVAASKLSRLFHSTASEASKVLLFRSAIEPVLLYGLEAVAMTDTRLKRFEQAHRALARFSLGIHFPEVLRNEELASKGFGDPTATLATRRKRLSADASPDAALSVMLRFQPSERMRRGMSRLQTLRDSFV